MLNDSKWVDVKDNRYELRTIDNKFIASMFYNEEFEEWYVTFENAFEDVCGDYITIIAKTLQEAKWKATVELGNYCNRIIHNHMKIRDHLPSLSELYDNALQKK